MNYTEKDLVAFGNFLLSNERKESIIHEANLSQVTDADLENFKIKDPFKQLSIEFRNWQRQWDSFDNGIAPKPKSVDEFLEDIKLKFEVSLL